MVNFNFLRPVAARPFLTSKSLPPFLTSKSLSPFLIHGQRESSNQLLTRWNLIEANSRSQLFKNNLPALLRFISACGMETRSILRRATTHIRICVHSKIYPYFMLWSTLSGVVEYLNGAWWWCHSIARSRSEGIGLSEGAGRRRPEDIGLSEGATRRRSEGIGLRVRVPPDLSRGHRAVWGCREKEARGHQT